MYTCYNCYMVNNNNNTYSVLTQTVFIGYYMNIECCQQISFLTVSYCPEKQEQTVYRTEAVVIQGKGQSEKPKIFNLIVRNFFFSLCTVCPGSSDLYYIVS